MRRGYQTLRAEEQRRFGVTSVATLA